LNPVVAAGSTQGTLVPGGQLMITTEVENYPGFPDGIEGPELMDRFFAQAKRFGAQVVEEFATEYKLKDGGPFQVKIGKQWYESEALIVANGASARWLNAPDEEKYRNNGISACATCDGPLPVFRNKDIFVLGGGDSAVEEATFLTRFAKSVSLVVRRDQLRASKIMQQRALSNPKIKILWNHTIVGYKGDTFLRELILQNTTTKENVSTPCGGLFMAIGHEPLTKYLVGTGIDLDDAGYIKVHNHVFTNINGVFAAGDVHDTHFRQAITAAGFGCMAAIHAERWLEAKNAKL